MTPEERAFLDDRRATDGEEMYFAILEKCYQVAQLFAPKKMNWDIEELEMLYNLVALALGYDR